MSMKKFLSSIIAAAMLLSACGQIFAEQPSGLKDVETNSEVNASASVDVKLETLGANLVVNKDIPYTVRL